MVSIQFKAVLDANVLYPFTLRDTLLRAAAAGFFEVRWSEKILDETTSNLVADGIVTEPQAARLRAAMMVAFPDARVVGFERLIASMQNDVKDRHVAAAAVKAGAQLIITMNIRDFRRLPDGVRAITPDQFLVGLFDQDQAALAELVRNQASDLRKPPRSIDEVLQALERVVPVFVGRLRAR